MKIQLRTLEEEDTTGRLDEDEFKDILLRPFDDAEKEGNRVLAGFLVLAAEDGKLYVSSSISEKIDEPAFYQVLHGIIDHHGHPREQDDSTN